MSWAYSLTVAHSSFKCILTHFRSCIFFVLQRLFGGTYSGMWYMIFCRTPTCPLFANITEWLGRKTDLNPLFPRTPIWGWGSIIWIAMLCSQLGAIGSSYSDANVTKVELYKYLVKLTEACFVTLKLEAYSMSRFTYGLMKIAHLYRNMGIILRGVGGLFLILRGFSWRLVGVIATSLIIEPNTSRELVGGYILRRMDWMVVRFGAVWDTIQDHCSIFAMGRIDTSR